MNNRDRNKQRVEDGVRCSRCGLCALEMYFSDDYRTCTEVLSGAPRRFSREVISYAVEFPWAHHDWEDA